MGQTNYSTGHEAEKRAADYLEQEGYKIIELNWRTPVCEIDIVAERDKVVYFVEVKYRTTNHQGAGLEYITPKKLQQMQFAARCWIEDHRKQKLKAYELAAVEVSGADYKITNFLPNIL